MTKQLAVIAIAMLSAGGAGTGQSLQVNNVMHEKLDHAQKILEAVVTSDWVALETHSRQLEQLTNDPRWIVLRYPEYARHSAQFVRAIRALHDAAARRDLEATPQAYVAVTLSCVDCHRYLARERIALIRTDGRR